MVPAAFDAGINTFFVSADMHWPLYASLREGLELLFDRGGDIRDRVVVAAVSYATQPEFCHAPFEEVIEAVRGLERIDLAIAGGAYGTELDRRRPIYVEHRARERFGVRAIGATFHDRKAIRGELERADLDVCLVRYNSAHLGARDEVFPYATHAPRLFNFKSTLGHVPDERWDRLGLHGDHWRPSITDHYRFVLSRPELDGILCSLREPSHLDALADAIAQGPLDEDEQEHLVLLAELDTGRSKLERGVAG